MGTCCCSGYADDLTIEEQVEDEITEMTARAFSGIEKLFEKLIIGPPSLRHVLSMFVDTDNLNEFYELVKTYIPAKMAEIRELTDIDKKISSFIEHFSNEYFPLYEQYYEDDLSWLTYYMPVYPMGFDDEGVHYLDDMSDTNKLILALTDELEWENGYRVSLFESIKEIIGEDLLKQIPADGWSHGQLAVMLQSSRYEAAAKWAAWLHHDTEYQQLNASAGGECYEDPQWDSELVETLADEWKEAEKYLDDIKKFEKWLNEDIKGHFAELLNYCLKQSKKYPCDTTKDNPKTLMEVFNDNNQQTERIRPANERDIETAAFF